MEELQSETTLVEFTVNQDTLDIAEQLLAQEPRVIGFGVYIWNVQQTLNVMRLVKSLSPTTSLVAGGPEATYSDGLDCLARCSDYLLVGPADHSFRELCSDLLTAKSQPKRVTSLPFELNSLSDPYCHYTAEDIANRVLYVEASRGCPFKFEFCLSSLDKTATAFDLDQFLESMQSLLDRGAKSFKFVDRTFNLKTDTSKKILEFFLSQMDKELFLHFELIPDRLPDKLKELLVKFPPNTLQFEIGIQSFNPEVQKLISRKQDHARTCENLQWLRQHTYAHIHADLIFGLPGETLASFASGFDLLYSLGPQEIQVGLLKFLKGTPISRHSTPFDMKYMSDPPYRVLSTKDIDFVTVQRIDRFARYWNMLANSGRFPNTVPLILADRPFERFLALTDYLYANTQRTHGIALQKLFPILADALQCLYELPAEEVEASLRRDFQHNRLKGRCVFEKKSVDQASIGTMNTRSAKDKIVNGCTESAERPPKSEIKPRNKRQVRH